MQNEILNLVDRILNRITGNDDKGRVKRFHKRLIKTIDNSIKVSENTLEDLESKLEDAKEQLVDAIEIVDTSKLETTESTDAYILEYNKRITNAQQKVEKLEEEIESIKEQIKAANERKELVK